jgi:hypothetical protein
MYLVGLLGRSFGYILPDERFGECEDALVSNLWVRYCCDVETPVSWTSTKYSTFVRNGQKGFMGANLRGGNAFKLSLIAPL